MSGQPVLSDKEIKKKMKPKFKSEYKKYYPITKLEELGFHRGVCSKCGTGYWNQDPSRTTCDDTVCSGGYRFIGKSIANKKLTYKGAWDKYVEIFNQWDYRPLDRYPVVARWYDDLYFTAAGINAFQPFIVAGHQDPPYQRVLEPQMCLRFNDIDNVGITGTHYTAFIMAGQHVFNSKRLGQSYWMPEGIEQIYTFLKDGLFIPPKEITFHEDIWAGGGNFGPSMEFFAGGMELGNQVYIQFDSATFEPLETQVIDMGAGLERWSWFSSGEFTSYETTFPKVMKFLYESTGIRPDADIWTRFMRYSGTLNVDEVEDVRTAWQTVASHLNMDYQQLRDAVLPVRSLYALADHTRNLLFAIRDGALPSNVGGGYNLRNLLRRCYSLIDEYKLDFDFHKLFEVHIDEIGSWFTDLRELGSLFDVLDLERDRYKETKTKNKSHIDRLAKEKNEISEEELLKLYDSKGITPEAILEVNPKIKIPENFYLRVNELHEKRQQRYTKTSLASKVPPTTKLYYEDTYGGQKPFTAKVLDIVDNKWLVLDRTHFYPEGGGQVADIGTLNDLKVLDTQMENQRVFHHVDNISSFKIGQKVIGIVDWERRYHLMKLHSATHLVNWASKEVLGPHIWQAGARKLPDKATLDITHYKSLSYEETQKIERLVNYHINEKSIESKIEIYPRTEAEEKFGMEIYQGGAIPHTELRIVQWLDDEACSGTHLRNSSEIGLLKIIKSERIQDGIVRLEYEIGERAILRMQKQEGILKELTDKWKISIDDIPKQAERLTSEWMNQNKELTLLREKVVLLNFEKVLTDPSSEIWIKSEIPDQRTLSPIFANFIKLHNNVLQTKPKTIYMVTSGLTDMIAISSDETVDLEVELKKYSEIVKSNQPKGKKAKKQEKTDDLILYQGFKVNSDLLKEKMFTYQF
jgi:alanyl-tRNA synthetase